MTSLLTKFLRLFFCILICLLTTIAKASLIPVNCSADKYTAKINEVNLGSGQFIEIYFINTITTSNWDICYLNDSGAEICSSTTTRVPANGSHSSGDFVVYTLPSAMDTKDGEILLKDGNGDAIDSLTYCNGNSCTNVLWDFNNSCTTTFTNHAVGQTDIFRDPDGTGNFDNNKTTTEGCSNNGCGGGGGGTPSQFNAFDTETTSNSLIGNLKTRNADNNSISFDVIALNTNNTDVDTNFSGNVKVELLANMALVSTDANNCPITSTPISTLTSGSISNGRSTVTLQPVSNVWKNVSVRISYPSVNPTITSCSNDLFAIRPAAFTLQASHQDWETAGNAELLNATIANNSTPIHRAGRFFSLNIVAVDSAGSVTTNYTDTPTASPQLLEPSAGILGTFNPGTLSASNGVITSNTSTYSEVGFISLQFTDTTFTNIDVSDGSTSLELTIASPVITVGRFTPDHFVLSNKNFEDRNNLSCSLDSSFTYIGEAFQTSFTVTAENGSNDTTQNYTGSFAKLGGSNLNFGAIDLSDAVAPASATALSSQLSLVSTSGSWTNGIANMTATLGVTRTSPAGPFESFNLGIAPTDSDGITISSYDLDTSVPSDSNDRELLATTKIRFGRLNIENAHGSELLNLPVPMHTEYYNGSDFITNTDDTCTPINVSQLSFNGGTNPITVGSGTSTASIANSPLVLGQAGLFLTAPGDTGFIDITSGTLITSYPWLSYDWDGDGNHDNSPSARATLGIYKGNSRQIYFREVY